jgi:hypothetical protein
MNQLELPSGFGRPECEPITNGQGTRRGEVDRPQPWLNFHLFLFNEYVSPTASVRSYNQAAGADHAESGCDRFRQLLPALCGAHFRPGARGDRTRERPGVPAYVEDPLSDAEGVQKARAELFGNIAKVLELI